MSKINLKFVDRPEENNDDKNIRKFIEDWASLVYDSSTYYDYYDIHIIVYVSYEKASPCFSLGRGSCFLSLWVMVGAYIPRLMSLIDAFARECCLYVRLQIVILLSYRQCCYPL